jgi:hypothetical protein
MLCMPIQYHTRNCRSGPGGAMSVGAHSAIILEYKRTMLSPEPKNLRGAQAPLQPRARAQIPCYVCQSNTTHAMAARALVARCGGNAARAVAPWAWEHTLPSFLNTNAPCYQQNPMKNPYGGPKHSHSPGNAPRLHIMYVNPIPHTQWPLKALVARRGALSVGAHSAIILGYKRTNRSPEFDG